MRGIISSMSFFGEFWYHLLLSPHHCCLLHQQSIPSYTTYCTNYMAVMCFLYPYDIWQFRGMWRNPDEVQMVFNLCVSDNERLLCNQLLQREGFEICITCTKWSTYRSYHMTMAWWCTKALIFVIHTNSGIKVGRQEAKDGWLIRIGISGKVSTLSTEDRGEIRSECQCFHAFIYWWLWQFYSLLSRYK